jgi:RsiW-degrading membrane proteinase PrsW (M82 family)
MASLVDKNARQPVIFFIVGVSVALFVSEVNALLTNVFSMEMTEFTIRITPVTEEILKAIPVLFFAREISNKRESIITISVAVGIGFAVMENSFILLKNIDSVTILWAIMRGFGTGMMHGMCTFLVGSGFSFINKNKKLFIVGTFSLMSLAITYHSVFNMLVQSEFYYFGALLPIVTFIPFAIARFKLAKEVKKNETV